jgi:hypothetical protein
VTPSRRHPFAVLGLVLPLAAFTVAPASAATSTAVHHKTVKHSVVAATHKVTVHHKPAVHRTTHRTVTHHATRKVAAS